MSGPIQPPPGSNLSPYVPGYQPLSQTSPTTVYGGSVSGGGANTPLPYDPNQPMWTAPSGAFMGLFDGTLIKALQDTGLVAGPAYTPPNLDPTAPAWINQAVFDDKGKEQAPLASQYWYGGSQSTTMADDMVYMGKESTQNMPQAHISLPGETAEAGGPRTQHDAVTVQTAMNLPYTWSQDKVVSVEKQMREAGLNVQSFDDLYRAWGSLVTRASRTFTLTSGKTAVSPWDLLEATKKENIANGTLDKSGNIIRTSTHTSIYNVTDGDAWASMKQATANLLGRDPTDQEIRDFASRASNVASNHPSTTTTTSTTDTATGNSSTSSSSAGGFDSNDLQHMAYTDAQNNPDYGAYQAAGTYMNALFGALNEVAPMNG